MTQNEVKWKKAQVPKAVDTGQSSLDPETSNSKPQLPVALMEEAATATSNVTKDASHEIAPTVPPTTLPIVAPALPATSNNGSVSAGSDHPADIAIAEPVAATTAAVNETVEATSSNQTVAEASTSDA